MRVRESVRDVLTFFVAYEVARLVWVDLTGQPPTYWQELLIAILSPLLVLWLNGRWDGSFVGMRALLRRTWQRLRRAWYRPTATQYQEGGAHSVNIQIGRIEDHRRRERS